LALKRGVKFTFNRKDFETDMDKIFKEISRETDRQDEKFGEQNHSPFYWLAVLSEEAGEAAKAALEKDWKHYRKEVVQIAAVTCQMIASFDRNKNELAFERDLKEAVRKRLEADEVISFEMDEDGDSFVAKVGFEDYPDWHYHRIWINIEADPESIGE
jgi:NTP pyrophosphatase (non-canonical NTP hydrolase)